MNGWFAMSFLSVSSAFGCGLERRAVPVERQRVDRDLPVPLGLSQIGQAGRRLETVLLELLGVVRDDGRVAIERGPQARGIDGPLREAAQVGDVVGLQDAGRGELADREAVAGDDVGDGLPAFVLRHRARRDHRAPDLQRLHFDLGVELLEAIDDQR
jgi:hypothetical protein